MNLQFQTCIPSKEQFWNLFQTTGWNDTYQLSSEQLIEALRASWYILAAYDDDKLVGFGRMVSDTVMHAMIYDLIVLPGYQRRGIGSQILESLIQHCKQEGIPDIQLFCAPGKRQFYEKHGFTARLEDGPGMQYHDAQSGKGIDLSVPCLNMSSSALTDGFDP